MITKIFRIREAGILFALIMLAALTASLNRRFLSGFNLQILTRQIAIFGIIAIGETFVIITKGIDLSPGSMVSLTCVLAGWFVVHGLGIVGSVMAVIVVSACVGVWHGFYVSKLRIPPFIITLCTFLMARGLGGAITKGWPINTPAFSSLWYGMIMKIIPVPVLILVVIAGVSVFILRYTPLGRHIYAVGGSIEAARLSGINVDATRVFVYTASTVLAGIVGILYTARLEQGTPNVGQFYEIVDRIAPSFPEVRWIISSSRMGQQYQPENEYVEFVTQPKAQYYGMLEASKLMLSTAYQENFGYTVLEATALNVPILCPDRANYPEMILSRENLYGDTNEAVTKIVLALHGRLSAAQLKPFGGFPEMLDIMGY